MSQDLNPFSTLDTYEDDYGNCDRIDQFSYQDCTVLENQAIRHLNATLIDSITEDLRLSMR